MKIISYWFWTSYTFIFGHFRIACFFSLSIYLNLKYNKKKKEEDITA